MAGLISNVTDGAFGGDTKLEKISLSREWGVKFMTPQTDNLRR